MTHLHDTSTQRVTHTLHKYNYINITKYVTHHLRFTFSSIQSQLVYTSRDTCTIRTSVHISRYNPYKYLPYSFWYLYEPNRSFTLHSSRTTSLVSTVILLHLNINCPGHDDQGSSSLSVHEHL